MNMHGLLTTLNLQTNDEHSEFLVIGSRAGVIETIHTLYSLGYAEPSAWSPLLPAPTSGEVMSILTRHR